VVPWSVRKSVSILMMRLIVRRSRGFMMPFAYSWTMDGVAMRLGLIFWTRTSSFGIITSLSASLIMEDGENFWMRRFSTVFPEDDERAESVINDAPEWRY